MRIENYQANIVPKYYKVIQSLMRDIQAGKYDADGQLPSKREIMAQHRISNVTATHVIHEMVREGTIYTIQGKGCFVQERRSAEPLEIRKESKRIALIMTNAADEYISRVIRGMLAIFQSNGYNLEVYYSNSEYLKETQLLSKCLKEKVAGIIFAPTFYEKRYNHLFYLNKEGIPVVLLLNCLRNDDFSYVCNADYDGVSAAMRYLIKQGHRKIVFLGGINIQLVQRRYEAYEDTLKKNRIAVDKDLVLSENGFFRTAEEEGYRKIRELLKKRPGFTAIFAKNDELLFGAYKALKEKGFKVPDDISMVGFDDNAGAKHFEVPLTTVRQDAYHIGYYAAKMLFKRIKNKSNEGGNGSLDKMLVKTKLIIRDSVKKVN